MKKGLSRCSGGWSTWRKTRGWGSWVCSAGRRAVCGGVQLLPCWGSWRRWQQAFLRLFSKMQSKRTRGKGCKLPQRIFSKQVKGNFFRMRAVKHLNRLHGKVVEPSLPWRCSKPNWTQPTMKFSLL